MTYYELLQVSSDAEVDVINAAWRTLMKRYHPDGGSTPDVRMVKELNNAHDALKDPVKRAVYDKQMAGNGARPSHSKVKRPAAGPGVIPDADPKAYSGEADIQGEINELVQQAGVKFGHIFLQHMLSQFPPEMRAAMKEVLKQTK